jgi:hypothetical protein
MVLERRKKTTLLLELDLSFLKSKRASEEARF